MANASPNATYIPLTGVGGNANFRFGVGKNAKNLRQVMQKIPACWYICVR